MSQASWLTGESCGLFNFFRMPVSLAVYTCVGILLMMYLDITVPPAEALVGRTFLFVQTSRIGFMLLIWCLSGAYWLREVAGDEEKGKPLRGRSLITVGLALLLLWTIACAVKPVLSTDVGLYVAEGRQMILYGQSPYLQPVDATMPDPFISQMSRWWLDQSSPYGPVALASFALVTSLSISTLLGNIAGMKVLMTLFLAATGLVAWKAYEGDRLRMTKTLALVGNPIVIWMVIVDAHLDIMLTFFLILAVEAARRDRPVWSGLWLACSCGVKIFAVIFAPVFFFWLFARAQRLSTWFAGAFGAGFALVATASGLGDLSVMPMMDRLTFMQACLVPRLFAALGATESVAKQLSDLGYIGFAGGLYVALLRGRLSASLGFVAALSFVGFLLTRPYWQPWYTVNFWPLLILETRRRETCFRVASLWMVTVCLFWMEPPYRDVAVAPLFLLALYWTWKDLQVEPASGKTFPEGST